MNDSTTGEILKAIVIGASSGIGLDSCMKLLQSGYEVYAISRDVERLKDNLSRLDTLPKDRFFPIEANIQLATDRNFVTRSLRSKEMKFDSLIFVSALPFGKRIGMVATQDIRDVFEVNTFAFFDIFQGISRSMNDGASVVVISSNSSNHVQAGNSVYGSSKSALERLSASFSYEFRNRGIRVNCVAPTLVSTEMLKMMDQKSQNEILERSNSERPLSVGEVTDLVMFLLSPRAIALNGLVLDIGLNLRSEESL